MAGRTLAVNDVIKAQIWSADSEQAAVNTFHYLVTAIGGASIDESTWSTAFSTAVNSTYKLLLNTSTTYRGTMAQVIFPLPLRVAQSNIADQGAGTGGAGGAARQTAGLISWKTTLAGPGGRGRTYIPFSAAGDSEGIGVPTAAYLTKLQNFGIAVSAFVTAGGGGNTATFALGMRSTVTGVFTVFTSLVSQQRWATQKRRGSYGRANTSPI